MSERTDEKINDLQLAVAKMRQQQEELQKKLKLEHDKKEKLEVSICCFIRDFLSLYLKENTR